jgi:two-component system response regulator MprA
MRQRERSATARAADTLTVLVVDDEAGVREMVASTLRFEHFGVVTAVDGLQGLLALSEHHVDAIVLDVGMPFVDGLEACRRIRAAGNLVPILMLTAKDAVDDRVAGLEAGADDYLVKPFALRELVARVRAITRRAAVDAAGASPVRSYADLRLDTGAHRAWRDDQERKLTRTEFLLLELLLEHPEQVLPRSQLLLRVWGYDFGSQSNSLGVYIGYLRRKLEAGGASRLIHTVRSVGYVLRKDNPPAGAQPA